jgi:hypothetical protein
MLSGYKVRNIGTVSGLAMQVFLIALGDGFLRTSTARIISLSKRMHVDVKNLTKSRSAK